MLNFSATTGSTSPLHRLFSGIDQNTLISIAASVGVHGLLWAVLPVLPTTKPPQIQTPRTVELLQLSPDEISRLPGQSSTLFDPNTALVNPQTQSSTPNVDSFPPLPDLPPLPNPANVPGLFDPLPPSLFDLPPDLPPIGSQLPNPPAIPTPPPPSELPQPPAPPENLANNPPLPPPELSTESPPNPDPSQTLNQRDPVSTPSPSPTDSPDQAFQTPGSNPTPSDQAKSPDGAATPAADPRQERLLADIRTRREKYVYKAQGTSDAEAAEKAEQFLAKAIDVSGKSVGNFETLNLTAAYPFAACPAKLKGTVGIAVLVDQQGKPDVSLIQSSGYQALDDAALDAASAYEFKATDQYQLFRSRVSFDPETSCSTTATS
jgi:TonB family protein